MSVLNLVCPRPAASRSDVRNHDTAISPMHDSIPLSADTEATISGTKPSVLSKYFGFCAKKPDNPASLDRHQPHSGNSKIEPLGLESHKDMPTTLMVGSNRPEWARCNEIMPKLNVADYGPSKYGMSNACWMLLVMTRRTVEDIILLLDLYDISFVAVVKEENLYESSTNQAEKDGRSGAAEVRAARQRRLDRERSAQAALDGNAKTEIDPSFVESAYRKEDEDQEHQRSTRNSEKDGGKVAANSSHMDNIPGNVDTNKNVGFSGDNSRRNSDSSSSAVQMTALRSIFGDDDTITSTKFIVTDKISGNKSLSTESRHKEALYVPGLSIDVSVARPVGQASVAYNPGDQLSGPIPAHSPRIRLRK
jgi:hypothetical protein